MGWILFTSQDINGHKSAETMINLRHVERIRQDQQILTLATKRWIYNLFYSTTEEAEKNMAKVVNTIMFGNAIADVSRAETILINEAP